MNKIVPPANELISFIKQIKKERPSLFGVKNYMSLFSDEVLDAKPYNSRAYELPEPISEESSTLKVVPARGSKNIQSVEVVPVVAPQRPKPIRPISSVKAVVEQGNVTSPFNPLDKLGDRKIKLSFSQAFANARRSGLKTFEWNGKLYTTDLKEQPAQRVQSEAAPIKTASWGDLYPTSTLVRE